MHPMLLHVLAAGMLASTPLDAKSLSVPIGPKATQMIDLPVCARSVYLVLKGDGNSDLDFLVYDPDGKLVHSDLDDTDQTVTRLNRTGSDTSCRTFRLEVINNGRVTNVLRIDLEAV